MSAVLIIARASRAAVAPFETKRRRRGVALEGDLLRGRLCRRGVVGAGGRLCGAKRGDDDQRLCPQIHPRIVAHAGGGGNVDREGVGTLLQPPPRRKARAATFSASSLKEKDVRSPNALEMTIEVDFLIDFLAERGAREIQSQGCAQRTASGGDRFAVVLELSRAKCLPRNQ